MTTLHVVAIIRQDHALILQLLDTLLETADRRETDYTTIKHELQGHMHAEEATLYQRMERSMHKRIAASIEEHNSFRKIFGRLDRIPPEREAWNAGVIELRQAVHRHIDGEEVVLEGALTGIPRAELFEMGDHFERAKRAMIRMASGQYG